MQAKIEALEARVEELEVIIKGKRATTKRRSRSRSPDAFESHNTVHVTPKDTTVRVTQREMENTFGAYGRVAYVYLGKNGVYANVKFVKETDCDKCINDKDSLLRTSGLCVERFKSKRRN